GFRRSGPLFPPKVVGKLWVSAAPALSGNRLRDASEPWGATSTGSYTSGDSPTIFRPPCVQSGAVAADRTSPADPREVVFPVGEHRLPNGLTLLTLEDHAAPLVSFQIHYAVGSRNERPGITGISHLFEHMMFKGTERRGPEVIAREIQANGGIPNAFTTT